MNFAISWIFNLFKKPQVEVSPEVANWPFPAPKEDKDFFGLDRPAKKRVKKTRALPSRATRTKQAVGKKATKVVKKATK
jgi:hypothetical protein